MKYLKYMPVLIGAVAYLPRVHAATALPESSEPGTLTLLLVWLALVVLAAGGSRSAGIKIKD